MGQFFTSPLLLRAAVLDEIDNVHSEFSRNCNSDARKLLQLRRSELGDPICKFSTGSREALKDNPIKMGLDVAELIRQLWEKRYTGGVTCEHASNGRISVSPF